MFDRVLIALDGSPLSERSLPWTRLLCPKAELTLVRVVPTWVALTLAEDIEDAEREQADAYLRLLTARSGVQAATEVRWGSPAEQILEVAEQARAQLIAITTHGGRAVTRRVFGGTTEKLLHASPLPLLVVPPERKNGRAPARIARIVVPLDGSEAAEGILPLARSAARAHEAELILTHCQFEAEDLNRIFEGIGRGGEKGPLVRQVEKSLIEWTARIESRLRELASECGREGARVRYLFCRGAAHAGIAAIATREKADLIVMSAHGHGSVKRILLGSEASKLIRESRVPVLVSRRAALAPAAAPREQTGRVGR